MAYNSAKVTSMCTTFVFPTPAGTFAGRNLDLDRHFSERVVLTPRNLPLTFRNGEQLAQHEALLGMATAAGNTPLYAEAINEAGLYMAGLYFPSSAHFVPRGKSSASLGIASFEFITYVLTHAHTVEQARTLLADAYLTDEAFAPGLPVADLHFFLADLTGQALVAEQTGERLELKDDPAQVLTNNPPLEFQLEHLRYFMHVSPTAPANNFSASGSALSLAPNAQGFGQIGIPGDSTAASRFIRAAFHVQHATRPDTVEASITQVFHILDAVSMVAGATVNGEGLAEVTLYSAALDMSHFAYYVTTYDNRRIMAVRPSTDALEGSSLMQVALQSAADFEKAELSLLG